MTALRAQIRIIENNLREKDYTVVAGCSLVGYILIGLTSSAALGMIVSIVLLIGCIYVFHRISVKKYVEE